MFTKLLISSLALTVIAAHKPQYNQGYIGQNVALTQFGNPIPAYNQESQHEYYIQHEQLPQAQPLIQQQQQQQQEPKKPVAVAATEAPKTNVWTAIEGMINTDPVWSKAKDNYSEQKWAEPQMQQNKTRRMRKMKVRKNHHHHHHQHQNAVQEQVKANYDNEFKNHYGAVEQKKTQYLIVHQAQPTPAKPQPEQQQQQFYTVPQQPQEEPAYQANVNQELPKPILHGNYYYEYVAPKEKSTTTEEPKYEYYVPQQQQYTANPEQPAQVQDVPEEQQQFYTVDQDNYNQYFANLEQNTKSATDKPQVQVAHSYQQVINSPNNWSPMPTNPKGQPIAATLKTKHQPQQPLKQFQPFEDIQKPEEIKSNVANVSQVIYGVHEAQKLSQQRPNPNVQSAVDANSNQYHYNHHQQQEVPSSPYSGYGGDESNFASSPTGEFSKDDLKHYAQWLQELQQAAQKPKAASPVQKEQATSTSTTAENPWKVTAEPQNYHLTGYEHSWSSDENQVGQAKPDQEEDVYYTELQPPKQDSNVFNYNSVFSTDETVTESTTNPAVKEDTTKTMVNLKPMVQDIELKLSPMELPEGMEITLKCTVKDRTQIHCDIVEKPRVLEHKSNLDIMKSIKEMPYIYEYIHPIVQQQQKPSQDALKGTPSVTSGVPLDGGNNTQSTGTAFDGQLQPAAPIELQKPQSQQPIGQQPSKVYLSSAQVVPANNPSAHSYQHHRQHHHQRYHHQQHHAQQQGVRSVRHH